MSSPYSPPNAQVDSLATNEVVGPRVVAAKPRLWTVWVTLLVSFAVYMVGSLLGSAVLAVMYASEHGWESLRGIEWLNEALASPSGLLLSLLPGHLALLAATIGAAIASPVPWKERLGLKKIQISWVTLVAAILATPFWALLWVIPLMPWLKDSMHLEVMEKMFSANGAGLGWVLLWLMVAVMPSFSEEFLFRGYIQSRLLQRISVPASIAISSVLFCLFHLDPTHVIAILPIGIWLGIIGWRAGSIIPAMLAHCYNNTLSIIGITLEKTDSIDNSLSMSNLFVLCVGAPAALIAIRGLWKAVTPVSPTMPLQENAQVPAVASESLGEEPRGQTEGT